MDRALASPISHLLRATTGSLIEMGATRVKRIVFRLSLLAAAMFGFGFALVPLYDVFCEALGIRSDAITRKVDATAALSAGVDTDRLVKVQFLSANDGTMGWDFRPATFEVRLHPGQLYDTTYYARNPAPRSMSAQAIPSISPGEASLYFRKIECFCFNRQTLSAGEEVDMPLRFVIDPALPKHIRTITLSYALFDVSGQSSEDLAYAAAEPNKTSWR